MNTGIVRCFAGMTMAIALSACGPTPSTVSDRYDPAKMDFKPPAAKLSSERHTGPFASGASLSLGAELKPLDLSPVKEVRLDTTHKIIEIAPGVKFSAWTFGDQVPGPTIRARVGDKIRFSMTNRSDETAPGLSFSAAPMMHSMDFHARWFRRRTNTVPSRRVRRLNLNSRSTIPACSCTTAARQ